MLSKEKLINYFKQGEKKSSAFKVGTEHEKFLFDIKTKKPVDFSENGIVGIFNILKENQWTEIKEKKKYNWIKKRKFINYT